VVEPAGMSAMTIERSCALTAVAFSERRREGARLVTGAKRSFGLNTSLSIVHVPYPPVAHDWTRRTLTCGVALQCSPSKDRLAGYRLAELTARERCALTLIEAGVALGWITSRWPGLLPEMRRMLPDLEIADVDMDATVMLDRAIELARTRQSLPEHPLLGTLPSTFRAPRGLVSALRRYGRMPWTTTQKRRPRPYSVPVGGDGGVRNPNLPPPSRPDDNDLDIIHNARKEFRIRSGMRGPRASCPITSRWSSAARAVMLTTARRCPPIFGNGSKSTPIAR